MSPASPTDIPHGYRCVCGGEMVISALHAGRLVVCSRCATPVLVPVVEGELAVELRPQLSLKTQRLEIEPAEPRDWPSLLPMCSDPENFHFEVSQPDSKQSLRRLLAQSRVPSGFRKHLTLRLFATRRGDGEPIGMVTLQLERDHLTASFGIMIHHPYHGMGLGSEFVDALNRLCFESLNLSRLSAGCDPKNKACAALLRSTGFEQEGRLRKWTYHPERGWIDCLLFAKLGD